MTLEYAQAVDEMCEVFNSAWQTKTPEILGFVPEVRWYGNEREGLPEGSNFWVRHSVQSVDDGQSTLSTECGEPGQKRFTPTGLIFIQFFLPKSYLNALEVGRKLAMIAKNAYRGNGTPGGVWFRNARINDVPPETSWYRLNVVVEFEYDELY